MNKREVNLIMDSWQSIVKNLSEDVHRPLTIEAWKRCKDIGIKLNYPIYLFK